MEDGMSECPFPKPTEFTLRPARINNCGLDADEQHLTSARIALAFRDKLCVFWGPELISISTISYHLHVTSKRLLFEQYSCSMAETAVMSTIMAVARQIAPGMYWKAKLEKWTSLGDNEFLSVPWHDVTDIGAVNAGLGKPMPMWYTSITTVDDEMLFLVTLEFTGVTGWNNLRKLNQEAGRRFAAWLLDVRAAALS
jgi:hypothetical protein